MTVRAGGAVRLTPALAWALSGLAGVLLLLWPAFYNGYPFVYSDTGGYLSAGFDLEPLPDRSMAYGLFIRFASLGVSLWGVAVVQAALLAYLIARAAQAFVVEIRPRGVLGIIAIVALLTPASWYASLIMMDVFAPAVLLSVGLFVYGSHRAWEKGLLAAIVALGVTTHTAHPVLALTTLAISGAWLFRQRPALAKYREWRRRLAMIAGVIAFATLAMMWANLATFGQFTLNPSSHLFLVGRLSETPLLKEYLERNCARESWALCQVLPELPYESAQDFLWPPAAAAAGGIDWRQTKPEYDRIVRGILTSPSGLAFFATDCLKRGVRLLGTMGLTAFDPERADSAATVRVQEFFPKEAPAYLAARQFNGDLGIRSVLEWMQLFLVVAAVGVLARSVVRGLGAARFHLVVFVCAGVIVNAFVMGGLSEVNGRYQARVAWLVVLLALVAHRSTKDGPATGPSSDVAI